MDVSEEQQALSGEIEELQNKLRNAKTRLKDLAGIGAQPSLGTRIAPDPLEPNPNPSLHALLLLSDSALPLGSFAYSSGLESFLAHRKHASFLFPSSNPVPATTKSSANSTASKSLTTFTTFLHLSLLSVSQATLPYLLTAYRSPSRLFDLDNDLDASTLCTVARRSSIAQGRALLSVWERSLNPTSDSTDFASSILRQFSLALKSPTTSFPSIYPTTPNAHLPPLFALVSHTLSLTPFESSYTYLLSHTKAVLSAAVRASVMGPYQAQMILASAQTRAVIEGCIGKAWSKGTDEAGQCVPVLDLWVGRHELLYSRIFNS